MSNSDEKAWCAWSGVMVSHAPRPTITADLVLIRLSFGGGPEGPSLLRLAFGGFGRALLVLARAGQQVREAVIALVARVLEQRTDALLPRDFRRPWPRPRGGVVHGEAVHQRVVAGAREALRQLHVRARSLERRFVGEVRRLDDERVAVPPAARDSFELPYSLRRRWTAVERDDARIVQHLDENQHRP